MQEKPSTSQVALATGARPDCADCGGGDVGCAACGIVDVTSGLQRAWTLWQTGESRQAESLYRELLGQRPACANVWQDRGNYFLRMRELEQSDIDLSAALHFARQHEQPTAQILNDRAVARFEAARIELALADADAALAQRPDFAQALSNRGNCLRRLGELRAAREAYNFALQVDNSDARVWHNRGVLHEDMGNLLAAQLDLQQAMKLDETHSAAANSYHRVSQALLERCEQRTDGKLELAFDQAADWEAN